MFIETVRVVAPVTDDNPLGFIVINAEDRTEDQELFVDPEDAAAAEAAAKAKADAEAATAKAKADADAAAAKAAAKAEKPA